MKGKNLIIMGIFVLMFAFPSFALNFSLALNYQEELIAGEKTTGMLTISNFDDEKGYFTINVLGPKQEWIITEKKTVILNPGETKTIKLYISTSPDVYEAIYKFRVYVTSHDGTRKGEVLSLKVAQPEKIRFSPLKISCERCSPGEKITVQFEITNLGIEKRTFEAIFRALNQEKKIKKAVEGRKKTVFKAIFDIDRYQPPKIYQVTLEVYDENGEKVKVLNETFEVVANEEIDISQKEMESFLERAVEIKISNRGNVENIRKIYSNASNPWLVFYFGPKAERINDKYLWELSIAPGETKTIIYKEFYWYKVAIIFAIIAIAIYLKFFCVWGVRVRKSIIYSPPAREGKTIGVCIELKTSKPLKKIVVRDFVPPSFELVKSFETTKPMRKELEEGVELIWKVRSMRTGEERVFHYKVKPKIGVIGKIKLPRACAKFEIEGKEVQKKSNFPELEGIKENV